MPCLEHPASSLDALRLGALKARLDHNRSPGDVEFALSAAAERGARRIRPTTGAQRIAVIHERPRRCRALAIRARPRRGVQIHSVSLD